MIAEIGESSSQAIASQLLGVPITRRLAPPPDARGRARPNRGRSPRYFAGCGRRSGWRRHGLLGRLLRPAAVRSPSSRPGPGRPTPPPRGGGRHRLARRPTPARRVGAGCPPPMVPVRIGRGRVRPRPGGTNPARSAGSRLPRAIARRIERYRIVARPSQDQVALTWSTLLDRRPIRQGPTPIRLWCAKSAEQASDRTADPRACRRCGGRDRVDAPGDDDFRLGRGSDTIPVLMTTNPDAREPQHEASIAG